MRRRLADRISYLKYAKKGTTATAYDPYSTDGFQYVIDSYIAPKYGDYVYIGCYLDTAGDLLEERALTAKTANRGVGSIEGCARFCEGFNFFGLENGNECKFDCR